MEASMFTRVLYTVAAAGSVGVGAIGVVAAPEATLVWVGVGVFIGALVWCATQDSPVGDAPATAATGRRAGPIAGVTAIAGCLLLVEALSAQELLLGPAP